MTRKRRIGILITFASLCFIAASCFSFCSAFRTRGVDPEANERLTLGQENERKMAPCMAAGGTLEHVDGSGDAVVCVWPSPRASEDASIWQVDGVLGSNYTLYQTTNHVLLSIGGQYQDGPRSSTHIYYVDGGAEEFRGVGGLPCNDACSSMMTSPRTKEEVAFRWPYVDRLLRIVSDCIREQCGVVPVNGARP